ncbi:pyruvate kinase [Effusibacillus lacus]|uniref:Pyruvate kinase n=1 Tax=Effusibacillus lacus TaxID=1348429 RepID=A0A292YCT0_9BACL|nr:pyruvate kinase [Effusibacillus lacus]TCS73637.1 pyruvate kinase [Effusibacillus lacus]GAX89472.1 pyruvate kinase [Effusibacillus lacus]
MRRTKIVCTIGPASESVEVLTQLIENGMNVARLNFSHGTYEEHAARIRNIREASRIVGKMVAILLDIKGPKIRTGMIENDQTELKTGAMITLTAEDVLGTAERVSISYKGLPEDVKPGSRLLIDDGLIGLVVEKVEGADILCRVVNGGILKNRKGINAPGVKLRIPSVTEKDIADIKFGVDQGVDMIAASFVRKAGDVLDVRRVLEEKNADLDIIAKIEAEEALDQLDEILKVADGLMVARGDLGVEIATEEVPLWQKVMIEKANRAGKPVITATQMLDSMERNPRPTRAEASDVANAIFDGTDAIMLSGETAAGKYPVQAVETMARIAERAERALREDHIPAKKRGWEGTHTVTDALSQAVATIAKDLEAKAIVTPTQSGHTARMVSKHRPEAVIIAVTPREDVARRLLLSHGVYPVVVKETGTTDEMLEVAVEGALKSGMVKHGDLVVITAGVPVGTPGTTNLLKVHTISDVIARGQGIGQQAVTGRVVSGKRTEDVLRRIRQGDILVMPGTDADAVPAMEKAAAVITEEGGLTSHAAVVGLSLGIPVIVGVEKAVNLLENGAIVTVDPVSGLIYKGQAQIL